MNSVTDLICELEARNMRPGLEDTQLRYRAAAGVLSNSLRPALMIERSEIVSLPQGHKTPPSSLVSQASRDGQACPMSYAQRRLWFLAQYEGAGYHRPTLLRLEAGVDASILQRAFDQVVARHEALRTTFHPGARGPEQRIHPPAPAALRVHDLSAEKNPTKMAEALAADYTNRPFDLETGPLWRAGLIVLHAAERHLILVLHHLVADAWSAGILQHELGEFIRAEMAFSPAQVAPVERQYAGYARMQQSDEFEARVTRHLPYWRKRLAGSDARMALPTDFPRPAVRSPRGRLFTTALPEALGERLRTFCAEEDLTPFAALLATFKVLIFRLSGQTDLSLGTPVDNRPQPEWGGVIGCFDNTLVLRTRIDPTEGFSDYAHRVNETVAEALKHQECPFERIVEELAVPRDLSRNPLFQIMFALQTPAEARVAGAPDSHSRLRLPFETARFDLNVSVAEVHGVFHIDCEYATDLLTENSIARLFRRYACVLASLLEHPRQALRDTPILEADERAQLVGFAAGPIKDYAMAKTIPERFVEQALANPSAPALKFGENEISYGDLDWHSENLAALLQRRGLGPGDTCALCMERSSAMVRAILAILKVGAAYVPLDPDLPMCRIGLMLEDSRPRLLLTQPHLAPKFVACGLEVIECSEDGAEVPNIFPAPHQPNLLAPAYVLYTSGSTGEPKAVVNHQRALINQLEWMQEFHRIGRGDSVLQKTNYAFDVSVWELLWPLTRGARLVLAAPGEHLDPAGLQQLIAREEITVIHFVPSQLQLFLNTASAANLDSLRAVFCSGEALSATAVAKFQALGLRTCLYHLYGLTEAGIDVTVWDCGEPPSRPGLVPIGRPIANLETWVLDERFELVPLGTPGEICLGGAGLATGYLNRPDLTAQNFVPHPFSKESGARLYRTGDLGRILPGGSLEYLGRIHLQAKLRGQRLEIGEIEEALLRLPGVDQAAVVLAQDRQGDPYLIGYLAAHTTLPPEGDLKDSLREKLPDYLMPARLIQLGSLPLNASGKIDRKALAARPVEFALIAEFVPPSGQLECIIAAVWSEVLAVEGVSVTQNFFEIGGNSLLMVRIHQRLLEEFKQDLPLVKLFTRPTVRGLARYLQGKCSIQPAAPREMQARPAGRQRGIRPRSRQDAALTNSTGTGLDIGLIGLAGRFPGARTLATFWSNIERGAGSVGFCSRDHLLAAGIHLRLFDDLHGAPGRGVLGNVEPFDATSFDRCLTEAALIEPRHRVFFETSWPWFCLSPHLMKISEFIVVVNHEEQFSLWPTFKPVPKGWSIVSEPASREHCLETIGKLWTDMRPKSLRKKIAR